MTVTTYELLILVGAPSIVTFFLSKLFEKMSSKHKKSIIKEDLIGKALQALLRDRLREHYIKHMNRRWIELVDKDNFSNMYEIYHGLGKNGVMNGMYEKIMALPTTKPKPKNKNK